MSYNSPSSVVPDLILWEQYQKSEPIKKYFEFYQSYMQTNFDKLAKLSLEITPKTANNEEYLEFLSKYLFNITRPIAKLNEWEYDTDILFDSGFIYDYNSIKPLSLDIFRRYLSFILNFNLRKWNILTLLSLISDFTDIPKENIYINVSSINEFVQFPTIYVSFPKTTLSQTFYEIIQSYKNPFLIPNDTQFKITLITT